MSYRTEPPFSGEYVDTFDEGLYICRNCSTPLYHSQSKFHSGCGWPSFDEEIPNAVSKIKDPDGTRIEILCAHCKAHLGHVFYGEYLTSKNTRHCVNSYALLFIPKKEIAVFGTGCFWCTEALFSLVKGVTKVTPGYAGGAIKNPSYKQVSTGKTGYIEVLRIEFEPSLISYENLLNIFWAIHDPTSFDRQGHDSGSQYRSVIFYTTESQHKIAEASKSAHISSQPIVTEIRPLETFYEAEAYHKRYFFENPDQPYCQTVILPKVDHLKSLFKEFLR